MWEEELVYPSPMNLGHSRLWLRYIDDVLMIWEGSEQDLLQFMNELNTNDRNIKLSFTVHPHTLSFLDLNIEAKNGLINTKTHWKSTAANTLLQATSDHPRSMIRGILVGQFLRTRRSCSNQQDFITEARDLYSRFRERDYSHSCIREAKKRAIQPDRRRLLIKKDSKSKNDTQDPLRIITKFGAHWDQVKAILTQHWHILSESPTLGNLVGVRPLLPARRSRNLKDHLIHSEFRRSPTPNWLTQLPPLKGMFRCGRCSVCRYVERTDVFTDSDGTKQFKIHNFINCNTTRVIDMLTCPCGKKYVGKRQLKIRIGEHV